MSGTDTLDGREIQRCRAEMVNPNAIFVFGSNRGGKHFGGAALVAIVTYGAVMNQGEGLQGRSYALPTMDESFKRLTLEQIAAHVDRLLAFAAEHPEFSFVVTRVGCGIAGFTDDQIAPLFRGAPLNCLLPEGWVQ